MDFANFPIPVTEPWMIPLGLVYIAQTKPENEEVWQ